MKADSLLIMGALGGLAYLYLEEESKMNADAENAATCGPLARLKVAEDGQKFCEPKLKCKEGFVLSQDMTQCFDKDNPCGPGFRMDEEGSCQITDEACGDRCYKLNDAKDNCIKIANCGTATGSEIGDVFLYLGESIVLVSHTRDYFVLFSFLSNGVNDVFVPTPMRFTASNSPHSL